MRFNRKGLTKKKNSKDDFKIIRSTPEVKGKFSYCDMTINDNIKKQIVSNLSDEDIIYQAKKIMNRLPIEKIHVKVRKTWDSL